MTTFHSEFRGDFFARDTIEQTRAARTGIPPFSARTSNERNPMAKTKDTKKQTKKKALKTPQQKRKAKLEKRASR